MNVWIASAGLGATPFAVVELGDKVQTSCGKADHSPCVCSTTEDHMFKTHALVGLLLLITGQAFALASNDTMAEWSEASAADRDALLDALGPTFSQSFKADRAVILNCLNQVGQNAAHAPLPIREVAKACVENAKSPEKTDKSDEI